ncbi:hypothetical protein IHQ68_18700 [Chelatococcus sambhunathii]|uniref:Uncharacterized protein n=1 Tax=Chelatococcus sambhunathii TaxID=363953 RepID=A0ABU1DKL7_9HYPH|nr:DUF6030 family protein [Chelatococcus sambhunathii]MDR4308655.1 hypothetical protein [Chelatococcus sambhunathii]
MPSARLISALLAGVLLSSGVAAVVVLRPPWAYPPAPAPKAAPKPPVDPLGGLPRELVVLLTHGAPDAPSPFIRFTPMRPEPFCKGLSAAGLKSPQFQKHQPPMRGWNCVTDLIKPIDGDDAKVSSLFVSMRGLESDRLDNIRIKLNLIDPLTVEPAKTVARDLLFQICRSLGWDPPQAMLDALETLKEGRIYERGVSFDLRKEFGDAPRYNLIIIFPRTLGTGGEDRFVTDVRRQPVSR